MKSLYGFDIRESSRDKRRSPEGTNKRFQIKELWDLSHEILRLSLLGMKGSNIAKYLNVSPVTVSNTINSDLGKEKLKTMKGARDADTIDIAEWIKQATEKSLKVYDSILDADEEISWTLKKNTADTVVKDLAGLESPKKIAIGHFSLSEIEAIKERGRRLAKTTGDVTDITSEGGEDDSMAKAGSGR